MRVDPEESYVTFTKYLQACQYFGPELEANVVTYLDKYTIVPSHGPGSQDDVLVWLRDNTNDIDSVEEYSQISEPGRWRNGHYG